MFKGVVLALFTVFLSLNLLECNSKSKAPGNSSPVGAYHYIAYDKTGKKIVEGQIEITGTDANAIKGNWQLRGIGDPPNIGTQVGTGTLTGTIDQDSVTINLNPNMADNNVTLAGKTDGRRIRGDWSFSGFAGVINKGTFTATKNR